MQAISAELTGHGGRMDDAARLYPDAPRPWLDLSTGINPQAWRSPEPIDVDSGPLPGRKALRRLETAAAQYFGVDPGRVAGVPGTEIALRTLNLLDPPRPVVSLRPSYGTHADIADLTLPQQACDNTAPGGTLLLANPNNPDGALLAPARLLDLARARATHGGWLIIDEAFADAVPGSSILPSLSLNDPVVVLRSFGKFFGLAGLRLGFVIAPQGLIDRVRHLYGDWPVSAHAIALGTAAYEDQAWIAGAMADLPARSARLDALLARHGHIAAGACPLFRLIDTPNAAAIFDRLGRAGILVRPFADRANWLRFGLPGTDAAFARLDRALSDG